jgi:hypothetical protein
LALTSLFLLSLRVEPFVGRRQSLTMASGENP